MPTRSARALRSTPCRSPSCCFRRSKSPQQRKGRELLLDGQGRAYYDREGADPDIFERGLGKYIDRYNNVRIKRRLDGSSPVEYRLSRAA
ncbi:IS3 family transposase [uncultured Senegalimassilia sp.]|uniref:IS3 family transposase n=1 Tax=uncultured Senegalimassilia sp. TaxID=1714350 RepID=UPI00341C7258